MPPLEKREFTPLQDVKGFKRVSNPFVHEMRHTTPHQPTPQETVLQPPQVLQFILAPPPVIHQNRQEVTVPSPPVLSAAPRQYTHPVGENVTSIPVISCKALRHDMPPQFPPAVETIQEESTQVNVPAVDNNTYGFLTRVDSYNCQRGGAAWDNNVNVASSSMIHG